MASSAKWPGWVKRVTCSFDGEVGAMTSNGYWVKIGVFPDGTPWEEILPKTLDEALNIERIAEQKTRIADLEKTLLEEKAKLGALLGEEGGKE